MLLTALVVFVGSRQPLLKLPSPTHCTMVMHQYLGVTMGILSLVMLAGAGVGVGSGIGMMTMAMAEEQATKEV